MLGAQEDLEAQLFNCTSIENPQPLQASEPNPSSSPHRPLRCEGEIMISSSSPVNCRELRVSIVYIIVKYLSPVKLANCFGKEINFHSQQYPNF